MSEPTIRKNLKHSTIKIVALLLIPVSVLLSANSVAGQSTGLAARDVKGSQASEYERWMQPWRNRYAGGTPAFRFSKPDDEMAPIVVVTVVTDKIGDDNAYPWAAGPFTSGYVVQSNGEVSWFSRGALGSKGSCCRKVSPEQIEDIRQRLASLPSDGGVLPPERRRLLIQYPKNGAIDARVFDLGGAPDAVWGLIRMAKVGISSYVPSFAPDSGLTESVGSDIELFGTSLLGDLVATSRGSDLIRIRRSPSTAGASPGTESIKIPQNVFLRNFIFSPNGSFLIGGGWGSILFYGTSDWSIVKQVNEPDIDSKTIGFFNPRFIENGKYLLFETSVPGIRLYETGSWREVRSTQDIPWNALNYFDSADGKNAFYLIGNRLILRRAAYATELLELRDAQFVTASFSLDGSRVAVVTSKLEREESNTYNRCRIRVWDTLNLKSVMELRSFEQDHCEYVRTVDWTADGAQFLALNEGGGMFGNRGISIWDTRRGRHIAELNCPGKLTAMHLIKAKNQIVAACSDQKVYRWNLDEILSSLRSHEQ